jgi:hypothetical protein
MASEVSVNVKTVAARPDKAGDPRDVVALAAAGAAIGTTVLALTSLVRSTILKIDSQYLR